MKAKILLILPALLACGWAAAQTNDNPVYVPPPAAPKPHVSEVPQPDQPSVPTSAAGDNVDPAKVAEYQKRFADGTALEKQGKLTEARAIYDGILAEQPNAKGSLLHAGEISLELGDLTKANDYLQKLHEIVPDFSTAVELLIQINQGLKRDVKVELLLRELRQLHDAGKVNDPNFIREVIHSDKQDIVITQFFDYTQSPNAVWMAEVRDANDQLKRRIFLNYDDETTRALRTKDAKYAGTQVFTWAEPIFQDGKMKEIDAYLQIFALPDYSKYRSALQVILDNPPKPIAVIPVGASPQ